GGARVRSAAGAVGPAVLGACSASRLASPPAHTLPAGAPGGARPRLDPATLHAMPAALRAVYLDAFTGALGTVFLVAACVGAAAFALSWLLEERPLRETVAAGATATAEAIAMPESDDSLAQVARGLMAIASRDVQKRLVER